MNMGPEYQSISAERFLIGYVIVRYIHHAMADIQLRIAECLGRFLFINKLAQVPQPPQQNCRLAYFFVESTLVIMTYS